jgi:DNA repair protein RadC
VQARRVVAAFALGREVQQDRQASRPSLASAACVHQLMAVELAGLECETFHVLVLDAKHRLRARECVSQGTLTASLVHPREVFRAAIRLSAAAVVVVHNHPSGDPEPSTEDLSATRRLVDAGRLLGIPLLDHVVIGSGRFVSLRERVQF